MKVRYVALVVMALMLFAPFNNAAGDQLADIKAAGKIVIGSDTTYPPFEFIDDDGHAKGFDVDLANELASRLGVTAEIKTVVWDSIIPSLNNKEFDVIISAMTITEERSQQIDFSIPYYNSSQAILVYKGNPKNVKSVADLNRTDLTIGVQTGTTSDIYVQEHVTNTNIVRLAAFDDLYLKLNLKEIDVILGDFPVVAYAGHTGAVNGEVVTTFGSTEQFGIGVRKGETNLLNAINDALRAMFEDGAYDKIFDAWFGTGAEESSEGGGLPLSPSYFLAGLIAVVLPVAIIRKRRK